MHPMSIENSRVFKVRGTEILPIDSPQERHQKLERIALDERYHFVAVLDAKGALLDVNRAALDGAGLTLSDLKGKPFWDCFWWTVSDETQVTLKKAVPRCAQGEFVRYDVEINGRAHAKETVVIDFSMIPVKDETGKVVYIVPEARDITEKKAYEQEIAARNNDLQALLAQTRELDKIKAPFFANVSHELRTTLQFIIGSSDRLLRNDAVMDTDQRQETARVIGQNARLLLKYVHDLLDISRFEAGNLNAQFQETDLASLIRRTASHFEIVSRERNVAFLIEADEAVSAVDAEKLQHAVMSLLSNAFKVVQDGGTVRVKLNVSKKDLVISIEDSGPGVKPEMRDAIFERFRPGDGAKVHQCGEAGRGLAIAKAYVEMHKGELTVSDSGLGGACFQATLPLFQVPQGASPSTFKSKHEWDGVLVEGFIEELRVSHCLPEKKILIESAERVKPTVLVVEDNADMNRFIVECLAVEYDVVAAFDGGQGLRMAVNLIPSLIISDIMMPEVSGAEMISHIRKRPELVDVPILLLSAPADEELKVKLLEGGAQDFVAKPFSEQDLLVRARNLVRLKNAQERYSTLFGAMDQGFCIIEMLFDSRQKPLDYRFLEVNAAFEKQTGLKDARGKRMRELAPAHEQHWFDIYGRIALSGESIRFENCAEALGRWFEVYAFRVGRPENRHVAIFFNDITQRKRAGEAIRDGAQRLHLALSAGQLGDWTWEAATDLVSLSPRAAEIFGLPIGSVVTWTQLYERFHQDDREMARLAATRALTERSDYNVEYRINRAPGSAWIAARGRGIYENNAIKGMTGVVQDVTAQRETEEALRQSEERFRAIFNQAAVGMAIAKLDGRFEQVNERFADLLGYSQQEIYQLTFRDLTYPDDLPATEAQMRRLMAGEIGEYVIEKRYRRKDGVLVWSLTTVAILRDAQKRPYRFTGVIKDITKRKRAEEVLRRSEEELRALANSIPHLAWMAEPDGHIFWYNQRWYDYTGTTLNEMAGWDWEKVHHPDHVSRVRHSWKAALSNGQPWEDTFQMRGADGHYRWFLSRAFPLRDADGKISRWFGTNTDIEDGKRLQDVLKEESRVLNLLNKTGAAIASQLDFERLVQTVTDAGTELSGAQFGAFFYNVIDEKGESFLLYALSGAPRSAFEKFNLPRNTPIFNPTFKGEGVIRSADITQDPRYGTMAPHYGMPAGHLPVRSYLAVSVFSRSGETIGGLFFGHSEANVFTERSERLVLGIAAQAAIAIDNARLYDGQKKAQEALRQAHEELELRVAERTAELREAVAQMEEFSYTVSHDLRAPLRGMHAYSTALLEDCGEALSSVPHAVEYLTRIAANATRLDRMALDVLTLSRVARGQLHLEVVSLDKLIRDLVEYYPVMHAPNAEITIEPLADVLGHEPSITQVMSNLMSNAIKFAAPGTVPKVRIWTQMRDQDVRIWVEDSGIGIDPKFHHRLFQIFERIHPDFNCEGTGVGLAIVRKAVARMNGSVGVESDGKNGSRFWIQLRGA